MAIVKRAKVPHAKIRIKRSAGEIIFDVINYTFLTLFGLCCLFPVLYEALMSVSSKADYLNANIYGYSARFQY